MGEPPDPELVERARRGDGAAIAGLFSRYWRAARAAAFGVTGEFASAEDAAAEAFRHALGGMGSLRDPHRFGSWLRAIVVRQARLEQKNRRPALDDAGLSDSNARPDQALERLESAALIRHAVRRLPDRLREAVALFYFEGYDTDAAARFLDIPAGTLRRRLHDGRTQLRDAVERILRGSKPVTGEPEQQIQKLRSLIENGEIYQAVRESLALRPPPPELAALLPRRQAAPFSSPAGVRQLARRFLRPSGRASDAQHPVGATAAAIRQALPEFQAWPLDAAEAAARFLTFEGEHRDRLLGVLPPGFAQGRPGAFLRGSRAILRLGEKGRARSVYEHLRASPDEQAFRAARNHLRMSDVLDLTGMVAGSLELRQVQELLERLSSAVLPGAKVRVSAYDEPRYRSALQLQVGAVPARAACGGVLAEWPGCPSGAGAAHVRIFLEPWATVRSGQPLEFDPLPEAP